MRDMVAYQREHRNQKQQRVAGHQCLNGLRGFRFNAILPSLFLSGLFLLIPHFLYIFSVSLFCFQWFLSLYIENHLYSASNTAFHLLVSSVGTNSLLWTGDRLIVDPQSFLRSEARFPG